MNTLPTIMSALSGVLQQGKSRISLLPRCKHSLCYLRAECRFVHFIQRHPLRNETNESIESSETNESIGTNETYRSSFSTER